MRRLAQLGRLLAAGLTAVLLCWPTQAEEPASEAEFACKPAPEAVVSLSIGSRYEAGSETRSEISEQSNEEVNQALEPVEAFINDLAGMANVASLGGPDRREQADCALEWLKVWAEGQALSELQSLNARLAVSPRLAGLALAYLQARDHATPDPSRDEIITQWLEQRGLQVRAFFHNEAGPLASRNNLRAWAGLATVAISIATQDAELRQWGQDSYTLLVCGAEPSGALPAEMERGERALHYQLHAVAPLVVTIGLLDPNGKDDEALCTNQLIKIADFTFDAVQNPQIVADLVGEPQVFSGGDDDEIEPYQMAWAEPYLARYGNQALESYVEPLRPLRYSKLGGNLTQIYGADSDGQLAVRD